MDTGIFWGAKPLYGSTRSKQPLEWAMTEQRACFKALKKSPVPTLILALQGIAKPFHVYLDEAREIAKGVLMQTLGPWEKLVAYLSKRLDLLEAG